MPLFNDDHKGAPGVTAHLLDHQHQGPSIKLAKLHQTLLPDSPIARLGTRFGSSIYYDALPADGLVFGTYALVGATPVGLAIGTDDPGGFMSKGLRANLGRMMLLAPTLIRPRALGALAEAIRIRSSQRSPDDHQLATGQVLTIGVLRPHRGDRVGDQRIGDALLDALVGQLAERGVERACLLVDEQNEVAQRFYARNGWHLAGEPVTSWRTPQLRMERAIETRRPQ